MPTRQAASIAQQIAEALDLGVDPTRWSADLRRNGRAPESVGGLAEQVGEIARRFDVTLLGRSPAALDDLLREETFPIVVLAPANGGFEATVLQALEGRDVLGVQIGADGEARPVRHPLDALPLSLRAGGYGVADEVRVLVPVSVAPMVAVHTPAAHAAGDGEAHGGGHDAHHGPSPARRLWSLLIREKRDILLILGYATLAGLFSLALPLSIQQVVQLVSGRMLLQPTWILVAFVLVGTVAVGVLQVLQMSVVETIQQRIFARTALEFGFRVPRIRYETVLREDLPEAMNRFFEVVTIQKSVAKILLDFSAALLTILFGLILLTLYHPYFTFFSAALVAGLGVIFWVTGPRGLESSINESKYKYRVVHWLEEMARALTAFKYAGRAPLPVERMDELVSGYLKWRKEHFRILVQQTLSIVGFKTLIVGTLLVLGIVLVQGNQITLGQFVASEIVIVTVLAGIEKLILGLDTIYDVLTSVDKIGHVSDLPLEATGGIALTGEGGRGLSVVARDLGYRYAPDAAPALDGVTLALGEGERVGITGYEGSGQTTLLKVIGGLLDGYHGSIAIDGIPMRDLDRTAYRDAIGQLLSPTDLFDGTVEENIAVGRAHVSTRDVLASLQEVGLGDWVQALPNGLRTPITNGGRGLPTHVVSRLLVAQAIVGRPRMVVVDDYYQNVEPECRDQLVSCLTDRKHPWTLVLVSHDPVFLAACDRVLVLEEGRVSREGRLEDLAHDDAFVQRLVRRGAALRP